MSTLRSLIEEAQTIIVHPEVARPDAAIDDPKFVNLLRMIQGLRDNVELSKLSLEELGVIKVLLKTIVLAASMTSRAAQMHLRAAYTALAKQALIKIGGIGQAVRSALEDVVDAENMVGPKEADK